MAISAARPAIDLRSDTVTRPTPAMRRAMAEASVGDDLYGEDPTVNRLQETAARLLGFEAALFVPTGTMGNEIAIRLLTEPGQQVLADERSHVVEYELSGMAVLSGVVPRIVRAPSGLLTPEIVRAALKPPTINRAAVALLVIENTHNLAGGAVLSLEETRAVIACARDAGLKIHLDGARLWHAAVALGVPPADLAAGADTVMVTLSKGLCCPAGSLLLSSREGVERARRVRQQLGGGMRQVGILAAAGLVALETMIPRLAEDHAKAERLAAVLRGRSGVEVAPTRTNIVVARFQGRTAPDVAGALKDRGVLAAAMDPSTLRLVAHHDVSMDDCVRAAQALAAVLG
jgi:threonine aldolase